MVLVAILLAVIVVIAIVDATKSDKPKAPKKVYHEKAVGIALQRTPPKEGYYENTSERSPLRSKTSKVGLSRYS